jgi:pimeloyl-ACP methyl ester carboxylesterase
LRFEPVTLAQALERFHREAVLGVCDTGRYRCQYYTWGEGPPLVCVPGLADNGLSFVQPLALLSRRFRCIAYDWPTGEGDGAQLAGYRHGDFVADLLALVDHVGANSAYLVGFSFGSTIALAALEAQPARLPRAVLLGGFARRRLAPAEVLLASLARYWTGPLRRLPLWRRILHMSHADDFARREPALWDFYLRRYGALPMSALARRALVLHQVDLRSLLPSICQPVLLICGDADPLVNKLCEAELLTGLPNALRVELADCGHMAIFTHAEAVADVVATFLEARHPMC